MAKTKREAAAWLACNRDGSSWLFVSYDEPKLNRKLNCFMVESASALVACVRVPDLAYSLAPGTCRKLAPEVAAAIGRSVPVGGTKCPHCRGAGHCTLVVRAQTRDDGVRIRRHKRSIECPMCEGVGVCSWRAIRRYRHAVEATARRRADADSST